MPKPKPSPVAMGSVVGGKYRVDRVIGSGGMGVVVLATHTMLKRRVAIKFLLAGALHDASLLARFSREARATAMIQSEHVVKILDVGALETGAPYIVMEHLDGADLSQVLRSRGPLPVPEVIEYVLQACEALAEAHVRGIVHRDLKPANLFLARRADGSPCMKVLDFGISKLTAEEDLGEVTQTQAMIGSPQYMAPEQIRSSRKVTDCLPVGSKSPQGDGRWGQADLAGNLNEWTLDRSASPYRLTPCIDCADLKAGDNRVLRGGGFSAPGASLKSTVRGQYPPDVRFFDQGFRCARQ